MPVGFQIPMWHWSRSSQRTAAPMCANAHRRLGGASGVTPDHITAEVEREGVRRFALPMTSCSGTSTKAANAHGERCTGCTVVPIGARPSDGEDRVVPTQKEIRNALVDRRG